MRQDQLDGIVTFIAVAEENGFSAAAVKLGVSPSAVSQAIRHLEARVGLTLFNRNTRGTSLTEAGAAYFERVLPAVRELTLASEELGAVADRPAGLLRLTVARSGYMIVLQPILRRFLDQYPDIRLDVSIENSLVDIVGRGYDAGIRFGDLVERDMVAVKIGPPITAHVIASPEYVARHGLPRQPHDLLNHACICFRHSTSGQIERWSFEKEGETLELAVCGPLIVNDSAALVQAALDGIGIAYMINGYLERFLDDGRLVRVLADWSPPLAGFTLYYTDRRRVPPKLRALIDFLRQEEKAGTLYTEAFLR
ncbi:LysR family transcriptional regulator [Trinickia violacea]|uniref:LysR family transcriptional regulator n=1 Tax=Trinickia violacea TaxID=2571746 RepID=A0A4P8J362_9BURK|nr:LysR family transcriptional regulator [Trinickia violacea]QCP52919.1 LysR family transcriptional regulator [Trinickia violacea]